MFMGKTNNSIHPRYASYSRGTETAKVEGLWLSEDPKACVKNTQTTVIAAAKVPELCYALLLYFPPSIA